MKHTPGPWTFHENGDGSFAILGDKLSDKEYRWVVGFFQNGEFSTEKQIANAKLIAAAPEMLEALQAANNYFVDLQNKCALTNPDERAWKLISKAIEKATT